MSFALTVLHRPAGRDREERLAMTGTWAPISGFRWADDTSVEGWSILQLGYGDDERDGQKIFDFAARPMTGAARTIKDVGTLVEVREDRGTPDPSRDFSGYWKTACGLGYGLEILRGDPRDPYTIGFCGPGGCDPIADRSRSHITGTSRYEILDADTIRMDGKVHHRCAPRYDGPGQDPLR